MEPYAAADEVWRAALVFARVGAIADWISDTPDDPARGRVEAHAAGLNALYGPANRASLGFILYLFRKPE